MMSWFRSEGRGAGNDVGFKFGRVFAVGQGADFIAGQRPIPIAAANENTAVIERV